MDDRSRQPFNPLLAFLAALAALYCRSSGLRSPPESVLTWAWALGEFGATITFAGNLPGRTQTMPLAIYISQSSNRMDEAIALSLILVLVSLVVMIFRREPSGAA